MKWRWKNRRAGWENRRVEWENRWIERGKGSGDSCGAGTDGGGAVINGVRAGVRGAGRVIGGFGLGFCGLVLCGCSAKLTTVRPSSVYIQMERISDGAAVGMPGDGAAAEKAEELVLQLEEPYEEAGVCAGDGHTYRVTLVQAVGGKTELTCFLGMDGSVCRGKKRYIPSEKADSPVRLEEWDAYFEMVHGGKTQEPMPEGGEGKELAGVPGTQESTDGKYGMPGGPGNWEPWAVEQELDIVACEGTLWELRPEYEIMTSVPVEDVLPWSYYISNLRYDGQDFTAVWRDTPKGEAQWLCSVAQTGEYPGLQNSIEYGAGSFEGSGRKYLYFTIEEAKNFHRSLWRFDLEHETFRQVLGAPCSNLLLLEYEPHEAQGIGWIVHDQYLAAIDLASGQVDQMLTIDLEEYLEDSLFYGIGDFGTHKYVRIRDLGEYTGEREFAIEIESILAEPETDAPERRLRYQFNLLTQKFAQIQ